MITEPVTPVVKVKKSKKSNKKAAADVRPGSNFYRLSAAGKKIEPKQIKGETHKGACLLALRKLGVAPFSEILAEVNRQKKIDTTMDVGKAVRWILGDMTRKGLLVASGRGR